MTHLFIINPAAGSYNRTKEYTAAITNACTARNLDYRVEVSAAPGECARLAREAAQTGHPLRIYACGGDGTLNEVVSGAAGFPNAAVTVFSGGSGNDFVKIFNEPKAFFDLERLLDAEETEFDLIECNGDLCLNICSVGLDARIGTDVASYKRIPLLSGFRAYAFSTLVNVIRGISQHFRIEVNGETIDGEQTMVCICNGRYYGGGFNPVPNADPADGLLDVLVVRKVSRLKVAQVVGQYKAGRYADYPQLIRYLKTDRITIFCDEPSPINLDGELRVSDRVDIHLSDKKVRFFYPKGLTWQRAAAVNT